MLTVGGQCEQEDCRLGDFESESCVGSFGGDFVDGNALVYVWEGGVLEGAQHVGCRQ